MAISEREQRGLAIAALCKIDKQDGAWLVPSQSGNGKYKVFHDGAAPRCTCPDFETRNQKCKHIFAVEYQIQREVNPGAQLALPAPAGFATIRHGPDNINDNAHHSDARELSLLIRESPKKCIFSGATVSKRLNRVKAGKAILSPNQPFDLLAIRARVQGRLA